MDEHGQGDVLVPEFSDTERASLAWLAGFEARTVENVAAVITRARQTRQVKMSDFTHYR